uniref:CC domain-containing protein n=1 Tax=Caenorhabditis tropicalis TaxID=1561998 RepID=A0A1I7U0Y7_9PELO
MNSKIALFAFLAIISMVTAQRKEDIFARAVGPCIADKCQSRHTCYYGQCVPDGIAPAMPSLDKSAAIGPCINYLCPGDAFCHQGHCYNNNV